MLTGARQIMEINQPGWVLFPGSCEKLKNRGPFYESGGGEQPVLSPAAYCPAEPCANFSRSSAI